MLHFRELFLNGSIPLSITTYKALDRKPIAQVPSHRYSICISGRVDVEFLFWIQLFDLGLLYLHLDCDLRVRLCYVRSWYTYSIEISNVSTLKCLCVVVSMLLDDKNLVVVVPYTYVSNHTRKHVSDSWLRKWFEFSERQKIHSVIVAKNTKMKLRENFA